MLKTLSSALPVLLLTAAQLPAQGVINPSLLDSQKETATQQSRRQTPAARAIASHKNAIVHVFVEVTKTTPAFKIERPSSGVVIDASGLVVTHWSLVREALNADDKHVVVQLGNDAQTRLEAKILAHDEGSGLALLRCEVPAAGSMDFLELANSSRMSTGERVVVMSLYEDLEKGKKRGLNYAAFAGIATRAVGGTTRGSSTLDRSEIILTDAAIQLRSDGGALIDANGRLLGLCSAEHVGRQKREPTLKDLQAPTFGYAIPSDTIRKALGKALAAAKPTNRTLLHAPGADKAEDSIRQKGPATAVAKIRKNIVGVYGGQGKRRTLGNLDPYATQRYKKLGSGVIVDTSGLVLTNRHLIEGSSNIKVTLINGKTYSATVLKSHRGTNTALLLMKLPTGKRVNAITCGNSEEVILGETVLGVGNPFGHTLTASIGVLSAKRGRGRLQADPNLGNSNAGGALIDQAGKLIGIVDGGVIDKIEAAFHREGDSAKTETNLSYVTGINALRRIYSAELDEHAGSNDSISVASSSPQSELEARRDGVTDVAEKTAGALLNVYIKITSAPSNDDDNPFAPKTVREMTTSLGSGVIISENGLALTNWHVVDAATNPDGTMRPDHAVYVRLRSGKEYKVRVLSISREDDLSLIQLNLDPGEKVQAIELGDSDELAIGETVLAIGNPHGHANTITCGIVSAKEMAIHVKGRWAKLPHLIETDAAINGGNSGGALLDINGKLVGINSAGGSGANTTGYSISVNHVRQRVRSLLLSAEKLRSPYVGMSVGDHKGHPIVLMVSRYSPAARADIKPNDLLLQMNGTELTWSVGYARALLDVPAVEPIKFQLKREGKTITKTIHPLSEAQWMVYRQTKLIVQDLNFRDAPKQVRAASIALHRKFTGDSKAEPTSISESLVHVTRLHPAMKGKVEVGDVFLGIELIKRGLSGDTETVLRFKQVSDLKTAFNRYGKYDEGAKLRCWLYRGGKVIVTTLTIKRIML